MTLHQAIPTARQRGVPSLTVLEAILFLHGGPVPMTVLAGKLRITSAGATQLVDTMAPWAERTADPGDRRKKIIRLNEAGRLLAEELLAP